MNDVSCRDKRKIRCTSSLHKLRDPLAYAARCIHFVVVNNNLSYVSSDSWILFFVGGVLHITGKTVVDTQDARNVD